MLVEKSRGVQFSYGIYASDGYNLFLEEANGWDGETTAPRRMTQLAKHLGITELEAQAYVVGKNSQLNDLFFLTDTHKFAAKEEIAAFPEPYTPKDMQAIVEKYKLIFESITNANV